MHYVTAASFASGGSKSVKGKKSLLRFRIKLIETEHRQKNEKNFTDYATAIEVVSRYDGLRIGIFKGFSAIDIDHCINEDGTLSALSEDIVELFEGCYIEKSLSGKGLRILFKASGFKYNINKYYINNLNIGVEVYVYGATNKFVTVTGNVIRDGDIEDWLVLKNTHKAIIDEGTWEIVQKIRDGKRCPSRMGEIGMLSGMMYCEDCGTKLYQVRANGRAHDKDYFVCATYCKHKGGCSSHQICNVVGTACSVGFREGAGFCQETGTGIHPYRHQQICNRTCKGTSAQPKGI
ncbi:MAG: recombinase zinc beta ribbon domain-containing protein [Tissierellales bacterium]|nr:recombinase zinc beta ribbon domain-containing protein [Tissierellales bacterium]MBN2827553.1 recombinase zinc beta ribbon domain-containing protein [Tissierellales bacterium]